MFRIIKYSIILLAALALFGYLWALPKLEFIRKNPSFCTKLTKNLYYCGDKADAQQLFETTKGAK